MRLLGRQRNDDSGTASDREGNRVSSARNATSPSRRASGAMAEALRRAGLLDESGAAKAEPGAAKPHRRDDRP